MKKKTVVIMGLGRFGGGIGVAKWFASQGHRVIVTDQQPMEKLADSIAQLAGLPIEYALGGHAESLLDQCDLLVVSPAVDKARSPFFQAAMARGIACTTEINEFCQHCPAPVVGVTGSAGKSTTVSMIYAVLKALMGADRCHLGGNIGLSLLGQLPHIRANHVVILELSSFMLEDTPRIRFSPHIAVATNLVNNHLDRHGSMEAYANTKINILRFQKPADLAILNRNDAYVSQWGHCTRGRVMYFDHADLNLLALGRHNQANAAAALAVVEALGLAARLPDAVRALQAFKSLPHRMEWVGRSTNQSGQNVDWINDSKATTPESTITTLQAVSPGRAVVIVGGADKHADMSLLAKSLVELSWGIVTMGATGPQIAAAIKNYAANHPSASRFSPDSTRLVEVQTLEQAVGQANIWACGQHSTRGHMESDLPTCVLLSPGCASYDQFVNYEQRGKAFRELVLRLHVSTSVA